MMRATCGLAMILLLGGCFAGRVKNGSPHDSQAVASLQVGTSTRADVLASLGAPRKILKLNSGEALVYEHVLTKNSGLFLFLLVFYRADAQRDAVTVILDEAGVVQAVGSTNQSGEASFGTPFGS